MTRLFRKHFPMPFFKSPFSSLRHLLFTPCFLLLTSIILYIARLKQHVPSINFRPPDLCHLIGTDSSNLDLWQYNSRSLCLSSHICFQNNRIHHSSNLQRTQCSILSPAYQPLSSPSFPLTLNNVSTHCQSFQHSFVHCTHGKGMRDSKPKCPQIAPLQPAPQQWLPHTSIIVPYYPWPWNIYHFINIVTDLDRTIRHLPKLLHNWHTSTYPHPNSHRPYPEIRNVNIIFQAPRKIDYVKGKWQADLLRIFHQRWQKFAHVSFHYMEDVESMCVRNAVVLGNRGSGYLWPFLNDTPVHTDGLSVPEDAVRFRRVIYDAFDVQSRLPDSGVTEAPPLRVGYARRSLGKGKDGYYRWGASRRFSAEEEKWFIEMLGNETRAVGGEFVQVVFGPQQSLEQQMRLTENLGMIVGIHGANLVNSVFMRPFGVLMEVFPKGFDSACYVGGMNAGLKYLKVEGGSVASMEESECHPEDRNCRDLRQRRVLLGAGKEAVREKVREGLRHIVQVRQRWRDGVSVRWDTSSLHYVAAGTTM